MKYTAFLLGLIISFSSPLMAKKSENAVDDQPQKLGEFGDWRSFVSQENGKKVCYMLSFPTSQEGDYKKRGKSYIMITHRPEDQNNNVVSVHAGYRYSKEEKPHLLISGAQVKKDYEMFVEGESAWMPSDDIDLEVTKLITKGASNLVVKGESFKGTKTTDVYSLKGSLAAYNAICQACEINAK